MKAEKDRKKAENFFKQNFFSKKKKKVSNFFFKVLLYGDLQLDIINYSDLDHIITSLRQMTRESTQRTSSKKSEATDRLPQV
jgi:hypothetical protein